MHKVSLYLATVTLFTHVACDYGISIANSTPFPAKVWIEGQSEVKLQSGGRTTYDNPSRKNLVNIKLDIPGQSQSTLLQYGVNVGWDPQLEVMKMPNGSIEIKDWNY